MPITYVVKSLEALAEFFDEQATKAHEQAPRARTRTLEHKWKAQAFTWEQAAMVVRNTQICPDLPNGELPLATRDDDINPVSGA